MPTAVDVNLDISEMVLQLDKAAGQQTIDYNRLDRLVFSREPVQKLFRTVMVRTIEVHVRGMEEPYNIMSNKVEDFELVEDYLQQMAERYNVKIEKQYI